MITWGWLSLCANKPFLWRHRLVVTHQIQLSLLARTWHITGTLKLPNSCVNIKSKNNIFSLLVVDKGGILRSGGGAKKHRYSFFGINSNSVYIVIRMLLLSFIQCLYLSCFVLGLCPPPPFVLTPFALSHTISYHSTL